MRLGADARVGIWPHRDVTSAYAITTGSCSWDATTAWSRMAPFLGARRNDCVFRHWRFRVVWVPSAGRGRTPFFHHLCGGRGPAVHWSRASPTATPRKPVQNASVGTRIDARPAGRPIYRRAAWGRFWRPDPRLKNRRRTGDGMGCDFRCRTESERIQVFHQNWKELENRWCLALTRSFCYSVHGGSNRPKSWAPRSL
jgi:hypothetical protein